MEVTRLSGSKRLEAADKNAASPTAASVWTSPTVRTAVSRWLLKFITACWKYVLFRRVSWAGHPRVVKNTLVQVMDAQLVARFPIATANNVTKDKPYDIRVRSMHRRHISRLKTACSAAMVATVSNSLATVALDLPQPVFASMSIPALAFRRWMFIPTLVLTGHKLFPCLCCILKLFVGLVGCTHGVEKIYGII